MRIGVFIWAAGIALGGLCLSACEHEHHHDEDGRQREVVVDEHGYRHEGYRDEHGWHGGYYDEHNGYHEDEAGWRDQHRDHD